MNIRPILQKVGLRSKEADIYLSCLEHGPVSITNMAKLSGYKRSTLYNIVEKLLQDGYLVLVRRNHRTLYDAERPGKLLTSLRARESELEQLIPELEAIRNAKKQIPEVQVFESQEAVTMLYDEIYDNFNNQKEFCFLTSIGDLSKNLPTSMEGYVTKVLEKKNYKIRELVFDDEAGRRHVRYLRDNGATHQIRLLPQTFPLYNDLVIYADNVVIFSFKNRIIATKFENQEISATIKTLFEWAWANGK